GSTARRPTPRSSGCRPGTTARATTRSSAPPRPRPRSSCPTWRPSPPPPPGWCWPPAPPRRGSCAPGRPRPSPSAWARAPSCSRATTPASSAASTARRASPTPSPPRCGRSSTATAEPGGPAGRSEVGRRPVGVELAEELLAPGGLVLLADGRGRRPQPVERPQEPAVLRVAPAHVARPPPAVGPEPVEAAVVADPAVRVPLDVVVAESGELRPGVEDPRPAPGDGGHRGPPLALGPAQRLVERGERLGRLVVEDGLGRAAGAEVHGCVGHPRHCGVGGLRAARRCPPPS